MPTGVIKGTLLCCDGNNFTWNNVDDVDGDNPKAFCLRIIYKIIIPIILSGGILGNILIIVILSGPMFRGVAYLYLNGLAMAHIGFLIFWIPLYVTTGYRAESNYPSAFYQAHLELVALNSFAIASTLIMICFIIDRYMFVFFPARIRTGNARKNVRSFILTSFILGFSASAPLAGMRMVYEQQNDTAILFTTRENMSVTRSTFWSMYIWILEIAIRIFPTFIFILLHSLIVKKFLQLSAKRKEFRLVSEKFRCTNSIDVSLLSRNRGYREEQHLVTLTTVMVLSFLASMLPSIMLPLFYPDRRTSDIGYQLFRTICIVSELSNFAIYFVIYLSCSQEFRGEILKILQGRCNEKAQETPEQAEEEIEDFSRNGTTFRLTPEPTRLNSPGSPSKLNVVGENKETELLCVHRTV